MKLWIIRPVTSWRPWYDKAFGFVVRAEDEETARTLAAYDGGDEVPGYGDNILENNPWIDPRVTTCEELLTDGTTEIVLRDFCAA